MGSVIVTWSGGCPDVSRRQRLTVKLLELGRRSHAYYAEPRQSTLYVEEPREGRILVDRAVFAPESDVSALPTAFEATPSNAPFKLCNPLVPEAKDIDDDLLAVSRVVLDGVAFHLYDGRYIYADEVSFALASFPDHPALGCRLVEVAERDACRGFGNAAIAGADLYLGRPHIHLRYYCEEWMDWLLAAVRVFFVPDLTYWRYEPQSGFEAIAAQIAALDPATAEDTVFAYLAERLDKEVESWGDTAAQANEFWSAVRGAAARDDETG